MDRILSPVKSSCYFVDKGVSFDKWASLVNAHCELLLLRDENVWLLFEEDAFQFSVLFFALLSAKKHIVLPQNGCLEQLSNASQHADAIAGSVPPEIGIECFTYSQHNASTNTNIELDSTSRVDLFTSGSTGEPKKIAKTLEHLIREVECLNSTFSTFIDNSTFLSTVSHQHIYGLLVKMLWPIWFGKPVILEQFEYPEHVVNAIEKHNIENACVISSPAHFVRVVKDNVYLPILNKLSCFISSGGPLLPSTAELLMAQLGMSPVEIFGSTETGGIAWRRRSQSQLNPLWLAFDDIRLSTCTATNCLQIQSPYLCDQNWYQTDDRVQLVGKNEFELLGRIDRIVKVEEKRVSLDQVQSILKQQSLVEDAYCLVVEKQRGVQVAAVVVLTNEGREFLHNNKKLLLNRAIQHGLKQALEPAAVPKRFRYVSALPYNASGKIMKKEMERLFD